MYSCYACGATLPSAHTAGCPWSGTEPATTGPLDDLGRPLPAPAHEHGAWVPVEWEFTQRGAIATAQAYLTAASGARVTKLLCGVGECDYVREVNHGQ